MLPRTTRMIHTGNFRALLPTLLLVLVASSLGQAQTANTAAADSKDFAPLQEWKNAVLAGDAGALKAIYSTDPATEVRANGVSGGADADINFWLGLKAKSVKVEIVRLQERPKRVSVIFQAEVETGLNRQTMAVSDAQGWLNEDGQWRLAAVERTDAPHLKQPSHMKKDIYPADVDAQVEIKEAEQRAMAGHKRLLLVFGANWCYDCHVLDLAFERPDFAPLLAANYEVVHVDLGPDEKKNADLVQQYAIPLDKGIPALAVADSTGKLVVSQKNGEFENARGLAPEVLLAFLNQWKP